MHVLVVTANITLKGNSVKTVPLVTCSLPGGGVQKTVLLFAKVRVYLSFYVNVCKLAVFL